MPLRYARELFPDIDTIVERQRASYPELTDERFWALFYEASPYSLVPIPGFYNVYQTMRYIASNGIVGDFVECGCFLGGMAIFIARMRTELALDNRKILLFDTFQGFADEYIDSQLGEEPCTHEPFLESVQQNFMSTVGHTRNVEFIVGPVEETVPGYEVGPLSLLRLDTDYYSSTMTELEHLYPKLSHGGAIIIDDYGLFQGSRKATDEYFARNERPPLLNRVNIGIWAGVKP